MHDAPSTPLSRRTLAKGVVWSVPAVVAASHAPALAASGCGVSYTNSSGGYFYLAGSGQLSTAYISFGRIFVTIPTGVTITSISVTSQIEAAGWPAPDGTTAGLQYETGANAWTTQKWVVGSSYSFYDTKNGGWTGNKVTYNGLTTAVRKDGTSFSAWSMTNTWYPSDTTRKLTSTTDGMGCTKWTLPEMGEIQMRGNFAANVTEVREIKTFTVTLSAPVLDPATGQMTTTLKWQADGVYTF